MLQSPRLGPRSWVQGSLSGDLGPRQGLKLLVKGDKDFGHSLRVLQAGSLQLHSQGSDLGPVKAHAQGAWCAPDRPLLHHLALLCSWTAAVDEQHLIHGGGGVLRAPSKWALCRG